MNPVTYRDPTTVEQALVEAFYLQLIAPGHGEATAAGLVAKRLSSGLTENTIAARKASARERFEAEETELG